MLFVTEVGGSAVADANVEDTAGNGRWAYGGEGVEAVGVEGSATGVVCEAGPGLGGAVDIGAVGIVDVRGVFGGCDGNGGGEDWGVIDGGDCEGHGLGVAEVGRAVVADPDSPNETAGVEGSGGLSATNEDLFFQAQPDGVDILWVLDNSCSMGSHLTALETEFDSFISSFTTLGLDYQMAVTTTDMETANTPGAMGTLLGPVPVISPATAAAAGTTVASAFDLAVEPNATGSADEQALAAAYAALSPGGAAAVAGLIRPDANLAIIVVGDEDDNSSFTSSAFISWFEALKGDPAKTTVSGILQQSTSLFDTNCGGIGSAPKLIEVVDGTGGIRIGICDVDFQQILRWLSYSAAGLLSEFHLSDEPLNGAVGMSVYVNGSPISRDPFHSDGWAYINGHNSVVFYGNSMPGPGAEVRIEYPVAGECN